MQRLHVTFDILRIMIDASDDDEVLDAAGDEEFAVLVEEAKIAGAKPIRSVVLANDTRVEMGRGGFNVAPVSARDIRAINPDLADPIGCTPDTAIRINQSDAFVGQRPAASDQR